MRELTENEMQAVQGADGGAALAGMMGWATSVYAAEKKADPFVAFGAGTVAGIIAGMADFVIEPTFVTVPQLFIFAVVGSAIGTALATNLTPGEEIMIIETKK